MLTGARQRARAFVQGRPRSQKLGALGAAALLATAPFGGLEKAPAEPPGTFEKDTIFAVGPYDVTIDRVVTADDLEPAASPSDDQHRLLVVVAEVTNTTDEPQFALLLERAFSTVDSGVEEVDGKPDIADMKFVADGTDLSRLNPGITYRVALIFEQDKTYADDHITLQLAPVEHVVDGVLTLDTDYWRVDPGVAAQAELEIEEDV